MTLEQILIGLFVAINLVAFSIMAYDKHLSKRGGDTNRISEGMIFFMAAALGGVGVYLGMLSFGHKTRKWYFQIGIPLMTVENIATVYLVWEKVRLW